MDPIVESRACRKRNNINLPCTHLMLGATGSEKSGSLPGKGDKGSLFIRMVGYVGAFRGCEMLVLSRKQDEKIIIGDNISLMVISIQGDKVRLGIEAPKDVSIHRQEVYDAIQRKQFETEEGSVSDSKDA